MALIEEFEKQGSFLFRWRSYIPVFILLLSAFYIPGYKYLNFRYEDNLIWVGFCILVSLFGLLIRSIVVGFAPARTSGRNTKVQIADVVNQTGIYSTVRHPLYVGNFFMFFGLVLFFRDFSFVLIFILFYWFYYERIMFTEEQFLRGKFGDDYLKWANSTPAIIPCFKNFRKPDMSFSFKNVLKREYPGFFGLVFFFTLYDVLIMFFNELGFSFDGFWNMLKPTQIVFFGVGASIYIIIRILVKMTKLLDVEGR
ncbi:MAG: lipid A Kdo2 1-phosphate O-methyltransferase [Leptospiraceae bacterium]|nr:lipid A Kdo2 1-phosphate O-methyltransferase [Leptospiraceae bacterium]MCK6379736.1 lipid A Kdo2 1-phosphate O-methyltransferase [Leptospiraceae bacterium]NUM41679.1 lipid A Kdo2 1-phosphate O-methyltransferase [Leptospiraceae bacterium]